MTRNSEHKKSFTKFMVMIFLLFSALVLALVIVFLTVGVKELNSAPKTNDITKLAETYAKTDPGEYKSIDVEKYLGAGSFVQIIGPSNNVIFSNNRDYTHNQYTEEELDSISGLNEDIFVSVDKFKNQEGQEMFLITKKTFDEEKKYATVRVLILDQNYNAVYTSRHMHDTQLTKTEYKFISELASQKYIMTKITFDDPGGEKIMISFIPKTIKNSLQRFYKMYFSIIIKLVVVYVLLLIVFTYWLFKEIRKPLKILNIAMEDLSRGKVGRQIEYKGPKEFKFIFDKFNEMSDKLYKYEQENQRLQDEKQKMVSDISHDLKTPITVIEGYSKAICDGVVPKDEQKKYLEIIQQKSQYMNELIGEFHDYTKVDHPDNLFNMVATDICEYMRNYFAKIYNEFALKGYNLEVDIPEERAFVSIDRKKFERAINNIVSNFFKYNGAGTTLYVQMNVDLGSVNIYIGDDGVGIDDDIRDAVFNPFVTKDTVRKSSSGLGLAYVKKIIEKHGGTIKLAENLPAHLSTQFIIKLKKVQ